MIETTLVIISTVFLTLGCVAFNMQQATQRAIDGYKSELKQMLEKLAVLHDATTTEIATLKKELSDLAIISNLKK